MLTKRARRPSTEQKFLRDTERWSRAITRYVVRGGREPPTPRSFKVLRNSRTFHPGYDPHDPAFDEVPHKNRSVTLWFKGEQYAQLRMLFLRSGARSMHSFLLAQLKIEQPKRRKRATS